MKAHRTHATVSGDGSVTLRDLPFAEGEAVEVIVMEHDNTSQSQPLAEPEAGPKRGTARDLLNSPLVGMWKDREDITDSSAYARELREKAQRRDHD